MTGQCISMAVSICNISSAPLHELTLSIRFYQDHMNGHHNYLLETRISTSGPNEMYIPVLGTNQKASHEIAVLFFNPGRFKSDIQCRSMVVANGTAATTATNTRVTLQQPPVMIRTPNMLGPVGYAGSAHTWRFIPSVDITVSE